MINDLGEHNIMSISETWFDENESDLNWVYNKNEYEILRFCRNKTASWKPKEGGVLF